MTIKADPQGGNENRWLPQRDGLILVLDEYQAVNLLWALQTILSSPDYLELNTGDWIGELVHGF